MKNLSDIKERYLKEPFNKRLGHLASDLARISALLGNSKNKRVVDDILEESKFFIEWTVSEAPSDIQTILSEMQIKLAQLHLRLLHKKENSVEIDNLKKITKTWSEKLLEISGLLIK
ncbi:MAG: hypothetical protein ACETVT_01440 [bacterium]